MVHSTIVQRVMAEVEALLRCQQEVIARLARALLDGSGHNMDCSGGYGEYSESIEEGNSKTDPTAGFETLDPSAFQERKWVEKEQECYQNVEPKCNIYRWPLIYRPALENSIK